MGKHLKKALTNTPIRIFLPILLLINGCGYTSVARHPRYPDYVRNIHTVMLLAADVDVYQQMGDGSMLWRKDASQTARKQLLGAVGQSLSAKRLHVRIADARIAQHPETQSILTLYRAVHRSIQLFPSKRESFDYELGSIAALLKEASADALVLVMEHRTVGWSQVKTAVSIALVKPGGRIIWYNAGTDTSADSEFQPARQMQRLVDGVLKSFSGGVS